jgi:hypothetical protein
LNNQSILGKGESEDFLYYHHLLAEFEGVVLVFNELVFAPIVGAVVVT